MQNNCKNNKKSEKFVVVDKKLIVSDGFKAELQKKYDENSLSELVNRIVGVLEINGVPADRMLTADISLDEVNSIIDNGRVVDIITVLEKLKEVMISSVAEDIAIKMPKVVLIAGPSSSGKTTFCKKMAYALEQQGLKPKMMSLDDYYGPLEDCPLDEHGEKDYENAVAASQMLFGKGTVEALKALDERTFLSVFANVPHYSLPKEALPADLPEMLAVKTDIFPSKGECRKTVQGGGLSINKEKVSDAAMVLTEDNLLDGKYILVQKGKKNYYLLTF